MDKNMINIDDLLKQRLTNGEEKQRPGAWLQMRELLDKEMPVTQAPAAAYNWRRMMGYLAGLALLATVSVGGYQVATRINADNNTTESVSQVLNNKSGMAATSGTGNSSSNNSVSVNSNTTNSIPNSNQPSNNTNTAATTTSSTTGNNNDNKNTNGKSTSVSEKNGTVAGRSGDRLHTASTNNNIGKPANSVQAQTANTGASGIAGSSTAAKSGKAGKMIDIDGSSTKHIEPANNIENIASSNKRTTANKEDNTENTAGNTQRNYGAGNNPSKSLPANTSLQNSTASATGNNATGNSDTNPQKTNAIPSATGKEEGKVAANTPGGQSKTSSTGNQPTEEKTFINKIETKEKYTRTQGWKKDTIAMGKMEWNKEEPMVAKAEESTSAIVPASSMSVTASEEKLVPLSEHMVSRKQTHYEKSKAFEQMVENAKMKMGSIHFYPGVIVGGNTSISGSSNQYGFQLGLVGNISLNEKWGILTELKYAQRMRRDSRLEDGYITNVSTRYNGIQNMTTWDTVAHAFNYATVNSIELPIAIKYALKRVNMFGGANLVYNFGVPNVEEIGANGTGAIKKEAPEASFRVSLESGMPKIYLTDFNSRFSIGYLIGAAYQFSPALQLDIRITQNVYDNAKTAGAKLVSKELYKAPSLQINMSYRFGSSRNRPMKAR